MPRRLLLFASTTGYQIRVFAEAARRLGVELMLATDRCHVMDDPWGDHAVAVKFGDSEESAESLAPLTHERFDGVAAVGDRPAVLAAQAAEMLGLPFHPRPRRQACGDKFLARQMFQAAGMRVPSFFRAAFDEDAQRVGGQGAISVRAEAAGAFSQPRSDPRRRSRRLS